MTLSKALFIILLSAQSVAWADSIQCTLKQDTDSDTIVLDVDGPVKYSFGKGVKDLGWTGDLDCTNTACDVYLIFDSSIVEDELTDRVLTLSRTNGEARATDIDQNQSADGLAYQIQCTYNK